jgi:uncharacterized protein
MKFSLFRRFGVASIVGAVLLATGCATLDEQQRRYILMPTERSAQWYGGSTEGMQEQWIEFTSASSGEPVRLHALWQPHERADAPVALFLHGARRTVEGSAFRIRHLADLGFSVLAIDYRGFGKSSVGLASEDLAYEDARAAWDWLAARHPQRPRYVVGHSLGGAIAVQLASEADDVRGLIVEGTFTSIPAVFRTMKWGWLPITPLITQRFDAAQRIGKVRAPVIVVHGSEDRLIQPDLGRALFEQAKAPKRFVLVEGGSHYSTTNLGRSQVREAMAELFGLAGARGE